MVRCSMIWLALFSMLTSKAFAQTELPPPEVKLAQNLKVGSLGGVDRLVFEGLKTFAAKDLRRALAGDFDVVLAADAHADLQEYLEILCRRLNEGYRQAGFPQAKISALSGEKTIRIRIEEGPRCENGVIVIEGPDNVDHKVLKQYLSQSAVYAPKPAENEPGKPSKPKVPKLWQPGKWTDFFNKPGRMYGEAIQAGLHAQGFFFPEFEAELKWNPTGGANLHVKVTDPGPQATIGRITLEGLQHHSQAEILEFLKIQPGQAVNHHQRFAWQKKLKETGCFLEAEISVLPAIAPGAPSELMIRLIEQPYGPRLGETLSQRDRIMIRAAEWITGWQDGGRGDLVVVIKDQSFLERALLLASPKEGMAFDVELALPKPAGRLHYTILVTPGKLRLYSRHHSRFLELGLGKGSVTASLNARFAEDEKQPGRWSSRMLIGWGFTTDKSFDQPFHFEFQIDPDDAIGMVRDPEQTLRETAGVLELEKKGSVIRIDRESGAVLSVLPAQAAMDLEGLRKSAVPDPKSDGVFAYFESGAFAKYRRHLPEATAHFQPAQNPQRPISSVLAFLLDEAEPVLPTIQPDLPVEAVHRLIQLDAIEPLDRLWVLWRADAAGDADFKLPWNADPEKGFRFFGLEKKLPLGLGKELARVAYRLHTTLMPPDSGPARVGWNLALLCTGRFGEAISNLKNLPEQPGVGPLTCWYAGRVFGWFHRDMGRQFAAAGLQKLTAESFRVELDHLLPQESLLFDLVGSLGNAIRQLDDDEFAQLASLLGKKADHPALAGLTRKLRREDGRPSREFLLEAIGTLWEIRGKDLLQAELEKLAPPAPAKAVSRSSADPFQPAWLSRKKTKKTSSKKSAGTRDLDATVERILNETGVR